jgi:hypothetical protein
MPFKVLHTAQNSSQESPIFQPARLLISTIAARTTQDPRVCLINLCHRLLRLTQPAAIYTSLRIWHIIRVMNYEIFSPLLGFCLVATATPDRNNTMLMASARILAFMYAAAYVCVTVGRLVMIALVGVGLMQIFDIFPSRTGS